MTQTMNAVRMHAYGGVEVLHYEQAPIPEPKADDVLIRVFATSVNPVDWKIRQGYLQGMLKYELPVVIGWDVAGEIVAVGSDVQGWQVGDAVYARPDISRAGTYAEFVAVRASEIARKPTSLDWLHAAAVPLTGLTAWQAFAQAELSAGQTVLIHAGAGGVGHLAIQIAKARGAHVIATCSTTNIGLVRELGADEVIDYTQDDFTRLSAIDVVLDTIGGETQERSWQVLKAGGALVSIIAPPSAEVAARHGVRGLFTFVQPNAAQLNELTALIDAQKIKVLIDSVYPLTDAAAAQLKSETGRARGKIVIQIV